MSNQFTYLTTSITWNGYDLRDYGLEVYKPDGRGMPPVRRNTQTIPGVHGEIAWGETLGPRTIRCRGMVIGSTRADCMANLQGIKSLLRSATYTSPMAGGTADGQAVGSAHLVFQDQSDRFWPAVYGGILQTSEKSHDWRTFQAVDVELTFICHCPFALATNPSYGQADGGGTRAIDRMIRCQVGDVPSKPIIEILGPATTPSVTIGDQLFYEDFDSISGHTNWKPTNYLNDSNMEASGTANWPVYSGATVSKSGAYVASGSQSLEIIATGANQGAYQNVSVSSGERYCLLLSTLTEETTSPKVQIWNVTASSELTSKSNLYVGDVDTGTMQRCEITFEIPAGCSQIAVRLLSGTAGNYYFDDVYLWANQVDNPSFEGTYVSGLAPNWSKTGSPICTESSSKNSGTKAQGLEDAYNDSNAIYQNVSVTNGNMYRISVMSRRVTGDADLVFDFNQNYIKPRAFQFTVPDSGPNEFTMITFFVEAIGTAATTFKIHQSAIGTKHIIDDFAAVELSSGVVNRHTAPSVHGVALELPDGESLLNYANQEVTDDDFAVAMRFLPLYDDSVDELYDLFSIVWDANHWIRLTLHVDYFVFEHCYDDSGLVRKRLIGDSGWTMNRHRPMSVALSLRSTTNDMALWVNGSLQANSGLASGYEADSAKASLFWGGPYKLDHVVILGRGLTDSEGSDISANLTPPEANTQTLSYSANLVAGDVLALDFTKRTATKYAAGSSTDVIANVSGPWGELQPGTSLVRLGATASGVAARWWKRWL